MDLGCCNAVGDARLITVGLAGCFIGTSVIKARFGADIQGMGTPGRISQFVTSDTIADSPIREANGNIAFGANARPQFKTLVSGGRLGVNANTTGGLDALVVNQGSGPIATLRSGAATEMIVDADGNSARRIEHVGVRLWIVNVG